VHINISTLRGFSRWKPAAWLRVSGADAFTFLQGQFSQDLRGLEAGQGRYGLWLTVKGKVLADSVVIRAADETGFGVVSAAVPAEVIRARLEAFIIADDVTVERVASELEACTVVGLPLPVAPAGVWVVPSRRVPGGVEWFFSADSVPLVTASLAGWSELDAGVIEAERIRAGRPAVPRDVGPEELPQEGGLEEDAVAFNKGCYLGQEVMARLHAMGRVRRRLLRVRGTGPLPAAGQALFDGERRVGEIRSAVEVEAGFLALALLTLPLSGGFGPLAFSSGGPAVCSVDDPLCP
jgi:folate-binding protein YgfZ